jgi:hypothetical protein
MNSPLPIAIGPLSASQRGAKKILSPFFCLQEKGAGGMSTCKVEKQTQLLLFIPDSHNFLFIFISIKVNKIN